MMDKSDAQTKKTAYPLLGSLAFVYGKIATFDRIAIPLAFVSAILQALAMIAPVIYPKLILDQLMARDSSAPALRSFALTCLAFGAAIILPRAIDAFFSTRFNNRIFVLRERFRLLHGETFMRAPYEELEKPEVLDMAHRASNAMNAGYDNGIEGVIRSSQGALSVLTGLALTIGIISFLQPLLLIAFVILLGANFALTAHTRNKEKAVNDGLAQVWRRLWGLNSQLTDLGAGKDLRLYDMAPVLMDKLRTQQDRRLSEQTRGWRYWIPAHSFEAFTGFLQGGIMYLYLGWKVARGEIAVGDFVMYVAAIQAFIGSMRRLFEEADHIRFQGRYLADFRSFIDFGFTTQAAPARAGRSSPALETSSLHASVSTSTSTNPPRPPRLEFRGISYRYSNAADDALTSLDLVIEPGERLAIVGLNGAGKSTFVKILTGLYRPTSGDYLVDGRSADDMTQDGRFALFAPAFQDNRDYAFSLLENVSMAPPSASDRERAREALVKAGLGEKLATFTKGLDQPLRTEIDEGGVRLSGGELQKLVLARAIYKDAPVLVLDEPTAALDALAEESLYKAFDSLSRGKTALYISHRLASTRFCDRVVLFEGGKVAESGSHEELLAQGGSYARLFELQARHYREGSEA